jgi:hypothetical protein
VLLGSLDNHRLSFEKKDISNDNLSIQAFVVMMKLEYHKNVKVRVDVLLSEGTLENMPTYVYSSILSNITI